MENKVRPIAFYLPQFHPIPENDQWWGTGFTEWHNVSRAVPMFSDHLQPRIPRDLGYYDLRLPLIQQQQADLAKEYGIYGFCYYYYWFNGKKLLQTPIEEMLRSKKPDFPFCLCWANENWTRRWDGAENEVLISQVHSKDSDERFILEIMPFLKDPRYILLDGAPLLLIYRVDLLPDAFDTVGRWRQIAQGHGLPALHVAAVQSFGVDEPRRYGCDSLVEFPPHGIRSTEISSTITDLDPNFEGSIFDYREAAFNSTHRHDPEFPYMPSVMVGWDNTPRRGKMGTIYQGSTPADYEIWLRGAIERAARTTQLNDKYVFINAWNEWAEGAVLEPDKHHHRDYLIATRRALTRKCDWRSVLEYLRVHKSEPLEKNLSFLEDIEFNFINYGRSLEYYEKSHRDDAKQYAAIKVSHLYPTPPLCLASREFIAKGKISIDSIDQRYASSDLSRYVNRQFPFSVAGWAFSVSVDMDSKYTESYLFLENMDTKQHYYGVLPIAIHRADVEEALKEARDYNRGRCGFRRYFNALQLPAGTYRPGVVLADELACAKLSSDLIMHLL